jgi:hypothetical protein
MTERTGTKPKTAEQVIGAFLMMHGIAPWEAGELIRWLKEDGFVIGQANGERGDKK